MKHMSSMQAEQAILYCLMREPSLLNQSKLSPDDFAFEHNRQIFEAITKLQLIKSEVDIVTVSEVLERDTDNHQMAYLGDIFSNMCVSKESFHDYEKIALDCSRIRHSYFIAKRMVECLEGNLEGDHAATAIKELMSLDKADARHHYTLKEALLGGLKYIEAAHGREGLVGISTGINRIDDVTGGYQKTDLNVIAARPAMGKTALALNMILNANCKAGFISAEQGYVQAAIRFIAIKGSLPSDKLRTANLGMDEWAKLSATVQVLQDEEVFINDKPGISITELERQARDWKYNNKIEILFVDYLQKIKGRSEDMPRTEQVTQVTSSLKSLARELDIPIVALAQVRRLEDRQDKRPKLGDMADASEIEKEADVIMTLYRDEVYDESTSENGVAEIDVLKNRHGQTGLVRCEFIGRYFQFRDFEPRPNYATGPVAV